MHPPKNAVAREPLLSAEPRLAYYLERLCSRRSNRSTASLRSSRWGRKRTRLDSTFFETRGRRRYLYWLCCGPLSYRLSFMQLSNTGRWVPRSAKRIWTFFLLQGIHQAETYQWNTIIRITGSAISFAVSENGRRVREACAVRVL